MRSGPHKLVAFAFNWRFSKEYPSFKPVHASAGYFAEDALDRRFALASYHGAAFSQECTTGGPDARNVTANG